MFKHSTFRHFLKDFSIKSSSNLFLINFNVFILWDFPIYSRINVSLSSLSSAPVKSTLSILFYLMSLIRDKCFCSRLTFLKLLPFFTTDYLFRLVLFGLLIKDERFLLTALFFSELESNLSPSLEAGFCLFLMTLFILLALFLFRKDLVEIVEMLLQETVLRHKGCMFG